MFKRYLIAVFAAGTLSISVGALAADWTGFNAGIQLAYGDGTTHFDDGTPSAGIGYNGTLFGVSGGYAWQFNKYVVGTELDYALGGNLSGSDNGGSGWGCGTTDTCTAKVEGLTTLRLRAGYDMDNFLPYLTAGLARGKTTGELSGCPSGWCGSETKNGIVYGLGAEYTLTDALSTRAEYLKVDLGTSTYTNYKAKFDFDVIRVSLNYNF